MGVATWPDAIRAVIGLVLAVVAYFVGRRGRAAAANRDQADATESLAGSVHTLGVRLDVVSTALWEAQQRLVLTEQRATAAEQRATAAELRAATSDARAATSDAELVQLRAEVKALQAKLAQYEAQAPSP
jgi:hypothetical protein